MNCEKISRVTHWTGKLLRGHKTCPTVQQVYEDSDNKEQKYIYLDNHLSASGSRIVCFTNKDTVDKEVERDQLYVQHLKLDITSHTADK